MPKKPIQSLPGLADSIRRMADDVSSLPVEEGTALSPEFLENPLESRESELSELQKEYKVFFLGKLKEWGVGSPTELKDPDKSKFFEEIKDEWNKQQRGASSPVSAQAQEILGIVRKCSKSDAQLGKGWCIYPHQKNKKKGWPKHYSSKKDAEDAVRNMHIFKGGIDLDAVAVAIEKNLMIPKEQAADLAMIFPYWVENRALANKFLAASYRHMQDRARSLFAWLTDENPLITADADGDPVFAGEVKMLLEPGTRVNTPSGPGVVDHIALTTQELSPGRVELEPPHIVIKLDEPKNGQDKIQTCICKIEIEGRKEDTSIMHQEYYRIWTPVDESEKPSVFIRGNPPMAKAKSKRAKVLSSLKTLIDSYKKIGNKKEAEKLRKMGASLLLIEIIGGMEEGDTPTETKLVEALQPGDIIVECEHLADNRLPVIVRQVDEDGGNVVLKLTDRENGRLKVTIPAGKEVSVSQVAKAYAPGMYDTFFDPSNSVDPNYVPYETQMLERYTPGRRYPRYYQHEEGPEVESHHIKLGTKFKLLKEIGFLPKGTILQMVKQVTTNTPGTIKESAYKVKCLNGPEKGKTLLLRERLIPEGTFERLSEGKAEEVVMAGTKNPTTPFPPVNLDQNVSEFIKGYKAKRNKYHKGSPAMNRNMPIEDWSIIWQLRNGWNDQQMKGFLEEVQRRGLITQHSIVAWQDARDSILLEQGGGLRKN